MATEEPKFTIVSKTDDYEVRKYESTIVAETNVDSAFDEAGSTAFRILADFIFGNNKSKEKIAMTAPVSQIKEKSGFTVQFTMPNTFTKETLPDPIDPRVQIKLIPSRTLAVFSYSGTWSEERFQEKLKEFVSALRKNDVLTKGEPVFSRYNPPFLPWFLRHNEIWLEVVHSNKSGV